MSPMLLNAAVTFVAAAVNAFAVSAAASAAVVGDDGSCHYVLIFFKLGPVLHSYHQSCSV